MEGAREALQRQIIFAISYWIYKEKVDARIY